MRKVVMDKPGDTIRPEEITDKMLVVACIPEAAPEMLWKLTPDPRGARFFWTSLSDAYFTYHDVFTSIPEAIDEVCENGGTVAVLNKGIIELPDWIRDNAG